MQSNWRRIRDVRRTISTVLTENIIYLWCKWEHCLRLTTTMRETVRRLSEVADCCHYCWQSTIVWSVITIYRVRQNKTPQQEIRILSEMREFLAQILLCCLAHNCHKSVVSCCIYSTYSPKWRKLQHKERILQLNKRWFHFPGSS